MSATLTVQSAGLHTLIVDAGRPRSRSLGVPLGGAADRMAHAIGNALVGNAPEMAALEISLVGPTLVANASLACVVYGAPFAMATKDRMLRAGTTFTLHAGEELHIGGTSSGMRAYLCIRGGIESPIVLGSRSSLAALQAGDRLTCHESAIPGRSVDIPTGHDNVLRILPGAQADWFPDNIMEEHTFEVTHTSNRMGIRLAGHALLVPARELVSEPVCPGTVQVTRDGQCIILGVDGQTIGGYPKIAQVIDADLDRLARLRPGTDVTFRVVTLEAAESLWRQRQQWLHEWLTRLQVSCPGGPFAR
jgi:biotin-dependent carboxylase-like uncharacterized protein